MIIKSLFLQTRLRMLKPQSELDLLESQSTDIYRKGKIEYYTERPEELDHLCLADFVACFKVLGSNEDAIASDEDAVVIEQIENETNSRTKMPIYTLTGGKKIQQRKNEPKIIRYCRYNKTQDPFNYFRELVMLFLPWRNEQQDIIEKNCEELVRLNSELIMNNYRKYNAVELDLDMILQEYERNREEENNELERGGMIDNENNFDNPNVFDYEDNVGPNIAAELGDIPYGVDKSTKYVVPKLIPEESYLELCDSLNEKQKEYLYEVTDNVKRGKLFYHVVSGGAGVGKSRLINAIYQTLERLFRSEPGATDEVKILLTAPTGKAAHNISGMTVHSAFHLNANGGAAKFKRLSDDLLNTLISHLRNLKLIIIDEFSMMSGELFYQMHLTLTDIMKTHHTDKIFGGIPIILFGHLAQLAPIGSYIFDLPKDNPFSNAIENPLWKDFELFELLEIMRQREDKTFAEALSRVAEGQCTDEDVTLFNSRCFNEQNLPEEGKKSIRLVATNEEAIYYNCLRINQEKEKCEIDITCQALDSFVGNVTEVQKRQALHSISLMPYSDTQGMQKSLRLMNGIRYMITVNVDVQDGLFNGATGILRRIDMRRGEPGLVYIEFDDQSIGKIIRSDPYIKTKLESLGEPNWTPIKREKRTFNVNSNGIVQVNTVNSGS